MARLFIGAGRGAGLRPGDLVGAITGEAGVEGKRLGSIEIGDNYSLVEVPESQAEQIITALRQTTLRGKKVLVRRDRG
jgi:ATP-dependent RNA helicase DeaD